MNEPIFAMDWYETLVAMVGLMLVFGLTVRSTFLIASSASLGIALFTGNWWYHVGVPPDLSNSPFYCPEVRVGELICADPAMKWITAIVFLTFTAIVLCSALIGLSIVAQVMWRRRFRVS